MRLLCLAVCLLVSGVAFSNTIAKGVFISDSCPPGDASCFLCGGRGGIPCTTNCTGKYVEGVGNVSCQCPQGEPCVCYCPVSGGEAVAGVGEGGTSGGFGRLTTFSGEVYYRMPGGSWVRAASPMPVSEGSSIRTGNASAALIILDDGSKLYVDENTELSMGELAKTGTKSTLDVVIELIKGAIYSDVTKRDGTRFDVNCQVSVPGVKGTKFAVYYDEHENEATVKAVQGTVKVPDRFGHSVDLEGGQMVSVSGSSGLGTVQEFDEEEEVRKWASSGGGCGSAFILPLALGAALALKRS